MKCVNIKTAVKTPALSRAYLANQSAKMFHGKQFTAVNHPFLFPVKQLRQMTNQVEYTDGVNHTLTKIVKIVCPSKTSSPN